MQSMSGAEHQKFVGGLVSVSSSHWGRAHQSITGPHRDKQINMSQDSGPLTPCALWSVDFKLTHLDWNPEATLIHFQGQYLTICELDYRILQGEIQNVPKKKASVEIGEFCLVEDLTSARWFRGRVQNQKDDLFDVFLIDHGNVLTVDVAHISSCSKDLFNLPPKIVCGFLANVLLLQNCCHSEVEGFFSTLIGRNITGFIQALLPHKLLLLEAPDINCELIKLGFGRYVDTDTFLLLVGMLTEIPPKQNIESVPDLLIENPRVQGFCFKSSSLQSYKDILSFCGHRLSCGTRAKVRVTAAVSPELFYCQMASVQTELWQISKKLAAVCEHRNNEPSQQSPENLGLLCAVKGKDERWHRGFVQFLLVNSQVRVFFIDYGFFEFVKVENIHRLPSEFYSTPIMGFPCSLPSLTDQDTERRAQQLSFLKAGLLGVVLDVEIGGFNEEQHLHTITLHGVENTHVEESDPIQNLPLTSVLDVEEMSSQDSCSNYETITSQALKETLEAEGMRVGSVFVGYVEFVRNPNYFWIRTQKRNEEFEKMMSEITEHFSQVKLKDDILLNPDVGTMCCALYEEDMHFYRGVVTDVLEHGAEILFIDFGNVEKVPYMLIKNLPETFAKETGFAIRCTLKNVFPLDDVWPSDTCDFFRKAVSNKALLVHVVRIQKQKCVVDLFEMGSKDSITKLLTSSKLAESIPTEPAVLKSKDVTEKTSPRQWTVTRDTSGKSKQQEDCDKEDNMCKNETEKAEASFKAFSIKPGFEFPVRCLSISSPSEFWCQPLDKVPALEKLMVDIQLYYSAHRVPLQPKESCCVAKSPGDGKWYRGLVVEKQKCHATVMLVDNGSTIQVRMDHLQAIMPEFLHLERQAFRCSFYNLIEPVDPNNSGDWSPEVCCWLKDFCLKSANNLKCQVVSQLRMKKKHLYNIINLYNTETQQSITNKLIEQGLARRATVSMKQRSEVFPESFIFSSFGLSPGTEEQVYVTYVSSQCEVYCHLEKNTEIIEELENTISEERETLMKTSINSDVKKLCLAEYLDGKWYRGLMLPLQFPLHATLFFVDYGNASIVEKTKVVFIPRNREDLLYTPMQAVKCNLDLVPKEEFCIKVKKWLSDAVLNKLVRAVVRAKREDGSFDVELFDGEMNINEKVKELILSLSQKPKTDVKLANRKTEKINQHPRNRKMHFKKKCPPKSQANTANVFKGTKLKNTTNFHSESQSKNRKVKQKNKNRKSSVREKSQTESNIKQHEHQSETPKQTEKSKETETSQLMCFPEKNISPGFRARCFVSSIDSVSSFFLQLSEDEPDILKMGKDLNSRIFRDSLKTTSSFRVNDVVLAEFQEDGALYRSVIKNQEASSFQVEFVDYGNSAVVQREKIYPLPEEFQSQPRFTIPCSLLDTSTYENDAAFTDAVIERPLMVDFVCQCGIQWQVRFEVLDGDIGHVETPESTNSTETDESPPGLKETSEKVMSSEQTLREKGCLIAKSKETISTVEGNDVTPESPPVMRPAKQKVKPFRRFSRTCSRKNNHWRTKRSSVKKDSQDAFLPLTIQPGDTETGTILWVQSDGGFYVRLTKNNDLLAALERHIADNINICKTVAQADVKPGLKCLVQIQDKWQRAVVQHIRQEKFKVFLVDNGITKDIPSGSIPQQCTDLTKFPNLAMLCKMNSLEFTEGEEAHQYWYETLEPMIGTEVKLLFESFSETDNLWVVEMVIKEPILIRQMKALLQLNERIALAAEAQSEAVQGGWISDTSAPPKLVFAPFDIDKPYYGSATGVKTPSEFCFVLEDLVVIMNKVSSVLDGLPQDMPPLSEDHLIPETGCLLKSESRNKWCRAEVVHVGTKVVLNLVDYGHYECIPYHDFSKIKKLPVELTNLPKVTYPCLLRGVKPVGDGLWTDEAAAFFQNCLNQKNLQIFFREVVSNSAWRVDIVADGVHVAKKLVNAGHASYIDVMLGLRFQTTSSCKPSQGLDSEEEESSNEVAIIDGLEGKESVTAKTRSSQCSLM